METAGNLQKKWCAKDIAVNEERSFTVALSEDGGLSVLGKNGNFEEYNFNDYYKGYYPSCTFSAIAFCRGNFYAAGVSEDGLPKVFTSLLGGVWEPVNLIPQKIRAGNPPTGRVLRILYEEKSSQVYLICENGELVTLPDCPKCVKVKQVTKKKVVDGKLTDDCIELYCLDGTLEKITLTEAVQYHASTSYLKQNYPNGVLYVDVRGNQGSEKATIEGSIIVPLEDLSDWLMNYKKETPIAFFCQVGIRSEEAVQYARKTGFVNAYSLGGLWEFSQEDFLLIKEK